MNIRFPILLAVLATSVWSKVVVPEGGHLGTDRIETILAVPDNLAHLSRDDREAWLQQAAESVVSTAHSEGRIEATCDIVLVKVDSAGDRVDLRVDYIEGPEYLFGKIALLFPDLPDSTIPQPRSLPTRTGQPFQQGRINLLLQETQQFYRHQGWLDATVLYSLETRLDSHMVDVRTEVRLGRVAIFDSIHVRFHGRHLTPTTRLQGLWSVAPGDTIRNEDIALYNHKLALTRLFNQARVTRMPSPGDSTRTDVFVDVSERVPGSLDLSFFWVPTFGWGVGGIVQHRNVAGSFNNLSLQTSIAQGMQTLRTDWGTPLPWGFPVAVDYGIAIQQQEAGLGDSSFYREFDLSNDLTTTYLPSDWSSVSLKLGTQRDTKFFRDGTSKVTYEYTTDLGGALDFRDQPFDPVRGWILRSDVGWGGQFLRGDTSFFWIQAQARAYQPLFWRFYSAAALDGGEFFNPTTFDGSKIFWLGGARSVRSYAFDALRAVPSDGYPLQPRYVRASGELRMNLPFNFQAVGFMDWARIWNNGQNPALFDLDKAAIGYGAGLRVHISLLSVRLDWCLGRGPERWAFDLAQAI